MAATGRERSSLAARTSRSSLNRPGFYGEVSGNPRAVHPGYLVSQRKRVEQVFGWGKLVGPLRKAKQRGVRRVGWMFTFTQAAYNLVRMRPLLCPTW